MRLRWTAPAANELFNIVLYNIVRHIQQDNPAVASELAESLLTTAVGSRNKFPYLARNGRIPGEAASLSLLDCPTLSSIRSKVRSWSSFASITAPKHGAQNWP